MAASCLHRVVLSQTLSGFRSAGPCRISAGSRSHLSRHQSSTSVTSQPVAGKHSACWVKVSGHESIGRNFQNTQSGGGRGGGRGGGGGRVLWAAVGFSLFSRTDEDHRDEAQRKEDEMILLLKRAKLSVYRGQLQAASGFLHQAVVLAHQTHNNQAIIYTYSQMANLAYVQGQLDSAEKLFKAAMSFMLSGGTPQDDNAVIEMSLKLATIYAEQNKVELAEHGFKFCMESLEAKLEKQKDIPAEEQTEEQEDLRKNTRLLLGLCLDSRARYRASTKHLKQAGQDYQSALNICRQEQGETHPQTLVLMSDLATILDLQGRHDDALVLVQQAVDLSRSAGHPDQHVLLGNMAGILLHTGRLEDSVRFYQEALSLAQQAGDQEAVDHIHEGLKEVKKKRKEEEERKEETKEEER
ncbi:tetratricopeptide repeat protein 19, mitochondrial [Thunnus maccoyii]|uniref:tetratricopeptide repeat protein 19, mitochondrial n=1 Tax=Thunnus maccoyii TaxID=8240 RepID=UPI001C4AE421|nr:tetratricopeptide repeat protein 19, mitochondrial [Thunnus maccoyii]XP_042284341.1 tetratricopeptide repeat protein 19, mitochondrial [Thunnus maccoyii]XP_042284342.1 tetratricopeptide repeat protein 19, mitochondrial [Thunnus maccoyii]